MAISLKSVNPRIPNKANRERHRHGVAPCCILLTNWIFCITISLMNGVSCVMATIRPDPTWYLPFIFDWLSGRCYLFPFCVDKFNFFDILILEVISRFVLDVTFGAFCASNSWLASFFNIYKTKVSVLHAKNSACKKYLLWAWKKYNYML